MMVYYYQCPYINRYGEQTEIRSYVVCVKGVVEPSIKSPIWSCNTSSWLVPGTMEGGGMASN